MNTPRIILLIVIILLVVWIGWSYFGTRSVERPTILSTTDINGIELREIAPSIQATVVVSWSQNDALYQGFSQLAGYIFGSNTTKQSVAMTAPVGVEKTNTTIAMTTPVGLAKEWGQYRVSFTMPKSYTLATLPKPVNNNISFTEIPAKKYYVTKFSGYANEARANKKLEKFLQLLQENKITTTATPILNQYNDPRTIPFMRTNEWWIEASK